MPQPLGVVGIIAPWNYPLQLTLAPAVGALAAGNRVMIKPSELVPRFSALLQEIIAAKFDATEITVTGIDDEIAKSFASLPFDHLIFTGSTRVGRLVGGSRRAQPDAADARTRRQVAGDHRSLPPISTRPRRGSPMANCSMPARPASRRITCCCRKPRCRNLPPNSMARCGACTAPSPTMPTTPRSCPTGIMRGSRRWWPTPRPRARGSCRRQSPMIPPGRPNANSRRRWWSAPRPT